MSSRNQGNPPHGPVATRQFVQNKYGRELHVDVAWIRDMPGFTRTDEPYRLDFYDVALISSGEGQFWLDSASYPVCPGTLFFTSPGQVRRWLVRDLDGLCLFFAPEFFLEHFSDPLFLHRLRFFHNDYGPHALALDGTQIERLLERARIMLQEFRALRADSSHLLRAVAYEVLVTLNRWYAANYGQRLEDSTSHVVAKFRQLVENRFRTHHRVSGFAAMLGITPGHLNHLCRTHVGRSAGDMIRGRLIAEAQRMLVHTELDVGHIGGQLGFSDPSYFSRAFKRATQLSPLAYRRRGRRGLESISG